ncbi:MAG: 4Fe-4S ferredoxin [Peptococcaceae bacterium BICA1-7]|nr:MAG: 4Fe-4S ferredoxin [Peptococcaceae bacterium BICA1-7]HBV96728.1 4Fe-4S ferredoxin [Desulfotomaculum sp.]
MIIAKNALPGLLDNLIAEYEVYAPVKEGTYSLFKQIGKGSEAYFGFLNSKIPPKGILFPQSEKLFSYSGAQMEECIDNKKKVVFGLRPCDAQSLLLLDSVFKNDKYEDPYYMNRRANTLLVGMACSEPAPTCFCTSMGGGPFDSKGLDVMLTDTGDEYLVEAVSEKGRELMSKMGLSAAGEGQKAAAAKVRDAAVVVCKVNTDGLKGKLDANFYDTIWESFHEKCLGCGSCTYSCPTCHCFDIVDEAKDCNGCRVRNWDSCMFPLFTLHGSGHNPRTTGKERMRQRVMHKFKYFVDNFNATACVGCGRCIKNCPVNLDIREILADIQGSEARSDK